MSLYSGLGGGGGPSAHADILSANPDNSSSRVALVEEIKRRGRACVVSKNYPDADSLYGKGIDVLSSALGGDNSDESEAAKKDVAILYSNRSLVRMQMGKVAEALEDADAAVRCDPSYVKAHWRRGQASNACGNLGEALESFERALALEPTNKALKKEVQNARKKKEEEEKMLAEAAAAVDGNAEEDVAMEDAPKTDASATKKDAIKGTKATTKPVTNTATATTVKETDTSQFTKSDHVRGYKIRSDGKKTSYFDREISDDAKKLIGDIAPKKLDASGGCGNDLAPKPIAAVDGTSAWNKAGTWEERDVTPWAKETLTASLLTAEYVLPDGSPSPGAHAAVSKVSKLDGHASYATVRGKKRYIYEFSLTIKWVLTLGDDHKRTCHGEMTFPDVDGTVEHGEGYDIVKYSVDGSSPAGTGPLLDRFVRDGGLRDSVHKVIDDWVRLFRATY
mmetsp:Transcript_11879/g.25726  ORF Transcript_11879/g.25726 Transcript_11879/m.25726 type:complete len:450 (-) Transcript_11879:189-1538(-)|eukprot:CAMPEP_0172552538 /NCGR_PEP_ID=MMETSP1067-20121228/45701_1 /TAXON_ID=265564 ORGANISM="Thalassiosira punctigera, Strain Tpunct2005C2" /NCGR_SAMPLE_ID=MMETSP1067 /ASSEMBLY_ACC=CAM_ASM_000444 /LENGTH=449 /DNA_ID=CAMNT_0013340535 /DNA_START=23 /DNA_END=1372 /DNA_ORIENTATION=+